MAKHRSVFSLLIAALLASVLVAPGAAAAPKTVVFGAGKIGYEYNISSGSNMSAYRSVLLNKANFGPDGVVEGPTISITDDVQTITSSYLKGIDVLYAGWIRESQWNRPELERVSEWVRDGGVVITTNDDFGWQALAKQFGSPIVHSTDAYAYFPTRNSLSDGPFGFIKGVTGIGRHSHFGTPKGFEILATDSKGQAVIVGGSYGKGYAIILGDEGYIRSGDPTFLGNLTHLALDKAGVLPEATPEPTPDPTATPLPAPTATPSTTPTPIPAPTATVAPTTRPTATPEPTVEPTTKPAEKPSLVLVTNTLPTLVAGDTAWVTLTWRALADVTDLRVTLKDTQGIEVSYPTNTADYSGLSADADLALGTSDYTAVRLSVPDDLAGGVKIVAHVTWTAFGQDHVAEVPVKAPTTAFTGDALSVITEKTSVVDGWISVSYLGQAPILSDFQLRVIDADDATIVYPRDAYTSLANDDVLVKGETDIARFFVDDSIESEARLILESSYDRNGKRETVKHELLVSNEGAK